MNSFIRYNEFIDQELKKNRYYDQMKARGLLGSKTEDLTRDWVNQVTELARSGKEIPWIIMNDLWNLDPESINNYVYRLTHDNPNIQIDPKWTRPERGERAKGWTKRGDQSTMRYNTRESVGFDYVAVAYQYQIKDKKQAEKIYSQALDITRRLVGNVPQNTLEREFPKELMDNYQDLLQMNTDQNYRENVDKENGKLKNKTMIREFLENDMPLDELINTYDLEEESYSQAMINPNTKDYRKKKREYATDVSGVNTGDLDDDQLNGYGTSYGDFDQPNGYQTTDDKEIIAKADPYAIEDQETLSNGEV